MGLGKGKDALDTQVTLTLSITPTLSLSLSLTLTLTLTLPSTQILPRFTSCFAQLAEGVAPNGHSMESWLQDLTAEMQASIEKHLSKVFKEDG